MIMVGNLMAILGVWISSPSILLLLHVISPFSRFSRLIKELIK